MRSKNLLLFSLLINCPFSITHSQPLTGWANNSVNTVVFRNNSIASIDSLQFMAYYDAEGFLYLAKRMENSADWETKKTTYRGNGNLVVNSYDTSTQQWTRLHDNLISGEGLRNA
jgi:hypothetical protein